MVLLTNKILRIFQSYLSALNESAVTIISYETPFYFAPKEFSLVL